MKNLLLEALTDYQKGYVDEHLGGKSYDPSKSHEKMFDSYEKSHPDRIFLDIPNSQHRKINIDVLKHLDKHGYSIEDYGNGMASKTVTDINGNQKKQMISIGKVLQRTGAVNVYTQYKNKKGNFKNLMELYNDSRDGVNKDLQLVISRDKHDIAGMSTGRHWQSCMTLPNEGNCGGVYHNRIRADLKHHTLVAYLVNKGDDNIEAPLGRVSIKKYVNSNGDFIYRTGKNVYGNMPPEYKDIINNVMKKHYKSTNGETYNLHKDLYPDNDLPIDERIGLIDEDGNIKHYNQNGELHDYIDSNGKHQPAVRGSDGTYAYMKNGVEHTDGDHPSSMNKVYNTIVESYYKNGMLHRENDEYAEVSKDLNGNLMYKTAYRYGMQHSSGKIPSKIHYHGNGKPSIVEYKRYDEYHSPDKNTPSKIVYNDKGIVTHVQYHKDGKLHREDDLPAELNYYDDGAIHSESYAKNGLYGREDDKPSKIRYNKNGKIESSEWHRNGLLHREGKPAQIVEDDFSKTVSYYENGNLNSPDNNTPSMSYSDKSGKTKQQFHKDGIAYRGNGLPHTIIIRNNDSKNIYNKAEMFNMTNDVTAPLNIKTNITPEHTIVETLYKGDEDNPVLTNVFKDDKGEEHTYEYEHSNFAKPIIHYIEKDSDGNITHEYKDYPAIKHKSDTHPSKITKFYDNGNLISTTTQFNPIDINIPHEIHEDENGVTKYFKNNSVNKESYDKKGKLKEYDSANLTFGYQDGLPIVSTNLGHFMKNGNDIFLTNRRGKFKLKNGYLYDDNGNQLPHSDRSYIPLDKITENHPSFLDDKHKKLYDEIVKHRK